MSKFLVIGAAVIIGGWMAWKALKREVARVGRELDRARGKPTETLTRDPRTGKYRIRENG
jgi:hypothetical protein